VAHALKNIVRGLLINKTIIIPQYFVDKYILPSNVVETAHLYDIIAADENSDIK